MTDRDVELVLRKAKEQHPTATPRLISDNGPQFVARDFKQFVRLSGMDHVRTSPYYPQYTARSATSPRTTASRAGTGRSGRNGIANSKRPASAARSREQRRVSTRRSVHFEHDWDSSSR